MEKQNEQEIDEQTREERKKWFEGVEVYRKMCGYKVAYDE